jgi:hypothetical protein
LGLSAAATSLPTQARAARSAVASGIGTSSALHEVFSKSGEAKSVEVIFSDRHQVLLFGRHQLVNVDDVTVGDFLDIGF